MADREDAQFAIVPAMVGEIQRIIAKNLGGILKIKPAVRKRNGALDRIVGGSSLNYCSYK
jgi:hypothetical protein